MMEWTAQARRSGADRLHESSFGGGTFSALVAAFSLAFGVSACVTVDYVGKSYAPTANVDVYMSAADVKRPYETMGQVRAEVDAIPFTNPSQQLQEKLMAEARSRGADGIILGAPEQRSTPGTAQTVGQATTKKKSSGKKKTTYTETTTQTTDEKVELRGTLIRYTPG
jgi:hypothetical protein